ncbi:MBL fold metallo-hydrolase [Rothia sp. CCM 9417]|uniref:MBL fold metallo-hydrolase n=1 Tax=unclassified Rothia (in: high G+C Gram-positive bacteria) TaxID=2689056 RepID=UPI003ACB0E23
MRLTVIGCAGSFPGPNAAASCYMVSTIDDLGKTWRIIIDMGNGALGTLQTHMNLEDIDAILISHLHPDHCIDLSGLHVAVKWNPNGWGRGPIPLYGPSDIHQYLVNTHGLPLEPGMHTEFEFNEWSNHAEVKIGPFTVTPYAVVHPVKEPYALRIVCETGEGKTILTYSGDTDSCDGLIEAARDADLFLCEAAYQEGRDDALRGIHLTGRRAGLAAQEAGVRNLLLTHLPIWNDPAVAFAEASEVFSGPISVAEASATYRVNPRRAPEDYESDPQTTTLQVIERYVAGQGMRAQSWQGHG